MNKKALKKVSVITGSILGCIYLLFLITPFIVNPFINTYCDEISKLVKDSVGLNLTLKKIGIVTTPKLTAGIKADSINVKFPTGEELVAANKVKFKLSLLPLIIKRIEADSVSANSLNITLNVNADGKFQIEDFLSELNSQSSDTDNNTTQNAQPLPFGLKLSNKLPDIKINEYNFKIVNTDNSKECLISGEKFTIKDFILNKKIKLSTNGEIRFLDRKQITYDIDIFNKIMPDIDLNDMLVTSPAETSIAEVSTANTTNSKTVSALNIIDIIDGLSKLNFTSDITAHLDINGAPDNVKLNGIFNVDNFTLTTRRKMLPKGHLHLKFKNKDIVADSNLYVREEEKTEFSGNINYGRKPLVDLQCKSNLNFAHLLALFNHILESFNIASLNSISADGIFNADFRIKSDMKSVLSDGHINISERTPAFIKFNDYNISIENIFADVDLSDNMLNVKNAGFSVAGHPLKIFGTVKNDSTVDMHLTASDILFKSLVALAGQTGLLKDNQIKSGLISVDASLSGKLNKLIPVADVNLSNLEILNTPSATTLQLPKTNLSILSNGNSFEGLININGLRIVNPLAVISMSDSKIEIDADNINILTTYILLNNSSMNFSGTITDYMTNKLAMNITGSGNFVSNDIKNFFPADIKKDIPAAGSIPISLVVSGNSKVQDISLKMTATPQNYAAILDVDALKGKNTVINSLLRIADDNIKLMETGIFADSLSTPVLTVAGNISHISSEPKLNLNIQLPKLITSNIPGFTGSKFSAKGDLQLLGTLNNPILKGDVVIPVINIPDMDFTAEDLVTDINGPILSGYGTMKKLKSGGIIAENLAADFGLKNYDIFYLKNITGDAFDGTINGALAYSILSGKTALDITGKALDAEKAIQGAAGIKNALSGNLDFNAKLVLLLLDYEEMMKSLTGNLTFNVGNGTFGNIGRFDTFIGAQNVTSNKVLSGAVESASRSETIKQTAKFESIKGEMTFKNGWADISSITVNGPYTSYYVHGRYNLLNGTTNVIILGRLASNVVALLGPLGELSVDKLTSYLPKFGMLTSSIIRAMTTNPETENVAMIPPLTIADENYKDFKVEFNGGIDSSSSVKSFKWLAKGDTSALNTVDIKQTATDVKNQLTETKDAIVDDVKEQFDNAKEGLKKLFRF